MHTYRSVDDFSCELVRVRPSFFCVVCRSAMIDGLVTIAKYQNSTFTENGFSNWKKALQRFDQHDKSEMHREAAIKIYFEVLDLASVEFDRRFDQSDLRVVLETESLLLGAANEDIPNIPQTVAEYFEKKIEPTRLRFQLLMLPDAIKTAHEVTSQSVTIKK